MKKVYALPIVVTLMNLGFLAPSLADGLDPIKCKINVEGPHASSEKSEFVLPQQPKRPQIVFRSSQLGIEMVYAYGRSKEFALASERGALDVPVQYLTINKIGSKSKRKENALDLFATDRTTKHFSFYTSLNDQEKNFINVNCDGLKPIPEGASVPLQLGCQYAHLSNMNKVDELIKSDIWEWPGASGDEIHGMDFVGLAAFESRQKNTAFMELNDLIYTASIGASVSAPSATIHYIRHIGWTWNNIPEKPTMRLSGECRSFANNRPPIIHRGLELALNGKDPTKDSTSLKSINILRLKELEVDGRKPFRLQILVQLGDQFSASLTLPTGAKMPLLNIGGGFHRAVANISSKDVDGLMKLEVSNCKTGEMNCSPLSEIEGSFYNAAVFYR